MNVSTDPMEVSKVAAMWAYVDAGGRPGVVIFTDGQCQIAVAKADRMKQVIQQLFGTVLSYEDTPSSTPRTDAATHDVERFEAK